MGITRWRPPEPLTEQEEQFVKRMGRKGKLFAFLRQHRHELLDEAFQEELEGMYRDTGAGKEPVPPGLMAMATLLQGYLGASDATMVELTVFDLRVQMVLDCLGQTEPAFSQGAFYDFRHRLIREHMDQRLLERTVEVARQRMSWDARQTKSLLKVAIDSKPLEGAGRVEDTINLLGHAARKVVMCVAKHLEIPMSLVCQEAGIPVLLESSVKKALDVDWNEREQKARALQKLYKQVECLKKWLRKNLPEQVKQEPLSEHLKTLEQVSGQNLEPDPNGGGMRIRRGVAEDRRVSIEDGQMRHGRKSQSKRFNGYKQHIATELEGNLILACEVTPANRPEQEATQALQKDIERQGLQIQELYIDRGYINSPVVEEVQKKGGEVVCKAWGSQNGELFAKSAFQLNMSRRTVTCPAGQTQPFKLGHVVEFEAQKCASCPLREKCTSAAPGKGRTVSIAENESLLHQLRKLTKSSAGRACLRQRVSVEHRLAHLSRRQGPRARYRGVRKNVFDLRRAAALQNIESWQRLSAPSLQKGGPVTGS
ncbi:IS1182 family transposase [Stigmatella sp. ncwal1]|uniref:IS1182 family transposase n=1 Tax=Stigmatella ashevillensis TaxID=2995309 RepID=A0ABT5DN79_9BACT|nr:IS1182 family transposase [Stigmatella ashevillena]MDC0714198.1 IS1182 family transposase [Stigmatella ashevillena]